MDLTHGLGQPLQQDAEQEPVGFVRIPCPDLLKVLGKMPALPRQPTDCGRDEIAPVGDGQAPREVARPEAEFLDREAAMQEEEADLLLACFTGGG